MLTAIEEAQVGRRQKLDLSGTSKLSALPESIGQLSQLQVLYLSRQPTEHTLPESLGQALPALDSLDLHGNPGSGLAG